MKYVCPPSWKENSIIHVGSKYNTLQPWNCHNVFRFGSSSPWILDRCFSLQEIVEQLLSSMETWGQLIPIPTIAPKKRSLRRRGPPLRCESDAVFRGEGCELVISHRCISLGNSQPAVWVSNVGFVGWKCRCLEATGSTIASRSSKHLCLLAGCDSHGISVV